MTYSFNEITMIDAEKLRFLSAHISNTHNQQIYIYKQCFLIFKRKYFVRIRKDMTFIVYFVVICIIHVNAFNPITIPLLGSSSDATHESITRCAFATVTSEYIKTRYQISITIPTITNGICPSSFFSQIKQIFKQIQQQGANKYSDWEDTIDYIVDRNSLVDVLEQTDESRHFDSESFIAASQIILDRYRLAVKALNKSNYENSNEYFGKMCHTLQGRLSIKFLCF